MSLINDALKQARKAPPRNVPTALPPLQPARDDHSPVLAWILPALLILLIVAGIFFGGWWFAHRSVHNIANEPPAAGTTQPVVDISPPVARPQPVEPPPPINPPDAPKLQGIFYSATSPSAIIDGKNVQPGDQFRQYRVKAISKYTVTLVGPDKKEIQIGMGR